LNEERYPLPGSSYRELSKIIQGYGSLREAGGPADVGKIIGTDQTNVSRNNGFLVAVGVVEGGKKKALTDGGRVLARALGHEMEEEVAAGWRNLLDGNEFVDKILSAVRIRKGMDRSSLQAHVSFTAGHPRKVAVTTGAGAVIDVLLAAGLLKDADGKLTVVDSRAEDHPETAARPEPAQVINIRTPEVARTVVTQAAGVGVQIHIQVQCTPADLAELAPQLRQLLDALNDASAQTDG